MPQQFQFVSLLTDATSATAGVAGPFSYLGVLNPSALPALIYVAGNTIGATSSAVAMSVLTLQFTGSISGGFSNGSLVISH